MQTFGYETRRLKACMKSTHAFQTQQHTEKIVILETCQMVLALNPIQTKQHIFV